MNVQKMLTELYRKARTGVTYKPQPYAKWNAEYARQLSESFGIKITLRPGRSKIRGATLSITTGGGPATYEITVYENQPGNLEHEIAHYIQFGIFGHECLMDRRNYAIEEIRAESTAYVLSMAAGNQSREARSVPYIRRYLRDAGTEPELLMSNIEARVDEFMSHGVMPPKYAPIIQKPRFRYGRCGRRLRHVYEQDGDKKSAVCVRCHDKAPALLVRMYGEPAPIVA